MRAVTARVVVAVVAVLLTGASPSAANSATTTDPAAGSIVYDGATIAVPASWPVYNLADDPTRCVRFDQHAVYLGHPGPDQRCPAHLVGRTTALLVEPYDDRAAVTPADADSGSAQAVSANGRVLITATYGPGGPAAASSAISGTAVKAAAPTPRAAPADPVTVTPAAATGSGSGFDTCAAPSKAAMKAWRPAQFRNVAIYIGGINRACADGNLNSSWVSVIKSYGYHLIPTYVGRQASCSGIGTAIDSNPDLAGTDGRNAAQNAVHDMQRLGLGQGDPIYLDIEQYNGDSTCGRSVLRFVDGWVSRLHSSGYVAGVYTSNFADLLNRYRAADFHIPDAIWIGRWNGEATVYGDPVVPDSAWAPHRRLHQYRGPHDQKHGGVTINIDTDYVDGPVA